MAGILIRKIEGGLVWQEIKEEESKTEFLEMDKNDGGQILSDELAH